jgi:hypothetical protein
MIRKQKGRVKSGSMLVRLAAKKQTRVVQKSRSCSLYFLLYSRSGIPQICSTGSKVNVAFYVEVLKRLRKCVRRVRPELWTEKNWILHHDNAPSHFALTVHEFFAKNDTIIMDHPSYSPDLAPCDFLLFTKVKTIMRGEHFGGCREHQM